MKKKNPFPKFISFFLFFLVLGILFIFSPKTARAQNTCTATKTVFEYDYKGEIEVCWNWFDLNKWYNLSVERNGSWGRLNTSPFTHPDRNGNKTCVKASIEQGLNRDTELWVRQHDKQNGPGNIIESCRIQLKVSPKPDVVCTRSCTRRIANCPIANYPTCDCVPSINACPVPPNCRNWVIQDVGAFPCARPRGYSTPTPSPSPTPTVKPPPIVIPGKRCCPEQTRIATWTYNEINNNCENIEIASILTSPILCDSATERCTPQVGEPRGICIGRNDPTPTIMSCGTLGRPCCRIPPNQRRTCLAGNDPDNPDSPNCMCVASQPDSLITPTSSPMPIYPTVNPSCKENNISGVSTAFGCIPTDNLNNFVGWILKYVIPIASGVAFLLMAYGAFQIITSAGDPKKVQAGQELITSALSGLLFIILSLFLLKLIGVDILKIPQFGV